MVKIQIVVGNQLCRQNAWRSNVHHVHPPSDHPLHGCCYEQLELVEVWTFWCGLQGTWPPTVGCWRNRYSTGSLFKEFCLETSLGALIFDDICTHFWTCAALLNVGCILEVIHGGLDTIPDWQSLGLHELILAHLHLGGYGEACFCWISLLVPWVNFPCHVRVSNQSRNSKSSRYVHLTGACCYCYMVITYLLHCYIAITLLHC